MIRSQRTPRGHGKPQQHWPPATRAANCMGKRHGHRHGARRPACARDTSNLAQRRQQSPKHRPPIPRQARPAKPSRRIRRQRFEASSGKTKMVQLRSTPLPSVRLVERRKKRQTKPRDIPGGRTYCGHAARVLLPARPQAPRSATRQRDRAESEAPAKVEAGLRPLPPERAANSARRTRALGQYWQRHAGNAATDHRCQASP
mmetsp:Transcript_43548/g.120527  ORF Transcript_43548/g.120527 Transcript_43548/m.120527 type:complete len:202 (+) Transcript_43548:151-756(+)